MSRAVRDMADLIASGLTAEQLLFFDTDPGIFKFIFPQQTRRGLRPALQRGWTGSMLDRCRDLIQHTNQPRPTAAGAIGADDEEACTFHHRNHPSGRAG